MMGAVPKNGEDTDEKPPASRGRRPDPLKRRAIMDSASALFLQQGYAVSMDAIAAAAGVSKQTVYNAYPTKNELVAAIIEERSNAIVAPLARHDLSDLPENVLAAMARQYFSVVISPASIALSRMLIAEREKFPELIETFYRNGPHRTLARLADYLQSEHDLGRLLVPDPGLSAEAFIGILVGPRQFRAMLDPTAIPDEPEINKRIAFAVDTFLRAHRKGA